MDNVKDEKQILAESLAKDILTLARNSLVVNFRFLDRAISCAPFVCDDKLSLATDGENIYYSPWFILRLYKAEQSSVARDILHCHTALLGLI